MNINLKSIADDIADMKVAILHTKTVFTPKEAASYMGISKSTLYKLTSAGILPFSKPNGKLIYFCKEKLDAWLLSNASRSGDERAIMAATHISINK